MAYKVLYRKYRPDNFNSLVGQDYTVSMLRNALVSGKSAHAYIFTGPRGTGKTSSAKIFAKALNCENLQDGNPCNECPSCLAFNDSPDIIEIDAASNNGVDEIRELINNVKLVPSSLKYKVYIIDEVHMLTASAFNALLLTLEEPPAHVVFILATTDIQNVPITILSRCQRFDFKPINKAALINRLKYVSENESIDVDDDALEEIALISAGGMRDALGMLDQLASMGNKITLDFVSKNFGSVSVKRIQELLTAISTGDLELFVDQFSKIKESGTNYTVFLEKFILELRKIAVLIKSGKYQGNFFFEDIYNLIFDLNECLCNININVDPYVLIEVVLLKYIKNYNPGNKNNDENEENYNLGNKKYNLGNKKEEKLIEKEQIENVDQVENEIISDDNEFVENVSNSNFNLEIRVNNCFVDASKIDKKNLADKWIDFLNFLMNKNRNLISLLADTVILAASPSYALIQSKVSSTNDLINKQIVDLERLYQEFSGNLVKFAALEDDLWKKEVEKYRINLKNKIKYSYIEEEMSSLNVEDSSDDNENLSDIESLAKDIFDSYEVK